ncbi:MAG: hypothetical protein FJ125_05665, partial [Deltaproteobacteria bacterium]|nr:hypothetical protein [Deltaproteobacteria bacterium]
PEPQAHCTRLPDSLHYCGQLACARLDGTPAGDGGCTERYRLVCRGDEQNACGGCGSLEYRPVEALPGPGLPLPSEGDGCTLPLEPGQEQEQPRQGRWTCALDRTLLVCRPLGLNLCGGSTPLPGLPGELCGFCSRYGCSADREGLDCLPVDEPPAGRPEICNGQDDDCDRLTDLEDEDLRSAIPPADKQRGVCAGMLKTCSGMRGWREPIYGEIAGYEAIEVSCDGLDNDCDGAVDEASDLERQSPAADLQLGVCFGALRICAAGSCDNGRESCWQEPDFRQIPRYEQEERSCDGLDNDCDGRVDEDLSLPRQETPCRNDGVCRGVTKICSGAGGWICPYPPAYEPLEGSCDGLDNDCDGLTDEDLAPPPADFQGGVCLGTRKTCNGLRGWENPDYRAIPGYEENERSCDGRDNDCDGQTDEGFFVDWPCQLPGVCGVGRWRCNARDPSQFVECSALDQRSNETCDGLDNDCDGAVDEQVQPPQCLSSGVCRGSQPFCRGEQGWICSYPASHEPAEQTCDGLDNDCDGQTDEQPLTRPNGLCSDRGVCAGTQPTCTGVTGWQCHYPATYQQNAELACDGLDNDCDGQTDEQLTPPVGMACLTLGICQGTTPRCFGAQGWQCRYPGGYEAYVEASHCDRKDNDCDGAVDEHSTVGQVCSLPGPCGLGLYRCSVGGQLECSSIDRRQTEVCADLIDNDCDGSIDEGVNEICADQVDNDCDGQTDEGC